MSDEKMCTKCGERPRPDANHWWCNKCSAEAAAERRAADPEYNRKANLRQRYGLTIEDYDAKLAEQGGVCAICKREPKKGQRLHVDHDHTCCPGSKKSCGKCLRALLCFFCNGIVGKIERGDFDAHFEYIKGWAR